MAFIARELVRLGFSLLATEGTSAVLRASGVPCEVTGKIHEGKSSVVDAIAAGEISLMINTPLGVATRDDGYELRRAATKRPLIVKLTPNVTDITEIAKAAEAAGADGISLINTLLGMAVDARTRRPKLARVVGGYSGPAVKPVALRMVWQVSQAVSVPVLGMGGIATGEDAVEFMLAGATAVAVGTANFVNPTATVDVIDGIIDYCESQGVKDVNELIGALQC